MKLCLSGAKGKKAIGEPRRWNSLPCSAGGDFTGKGINGEGGVDGTSFVKDGK